MNNAAEQFPSTTSFVFITGASNGLGRELAKVYAKHGYPLLLTGLDKSALEETVQMVKRDGTTVLSIAEDLSQPDAVDNLIAFIIKEKLNISVLINNAGLGSHANFKDISDTELNALLDVNIKSLTTLTRHLVPMMAEKKQGVIVNIASVYAYASIPGQVLYSATKAFVKSFSLGLAMDLKKEGIMVSCICPGSTTGTKFRQRIGLSIKRKQFSAPADLIAEKIYKSLKHPKLIYTPLWYNRLFVFIIQLIPNSWMQKLVTLIVYRLRKIKECNSE